MELETGKKKNRLTLYIFIALLAGIILGFILNKNYVGEENSKIADAEMVQKEAAAAAKKYETVSDTAALSRLKAAKKSIEDNVTKALAELVKAPGNTQVAASVQVWKDSAKQVQTSLAALCDTNSVQYKELVKYKDALGVKKNDAIKARDKKLDWFSILADIFIRLIKMIVAPLVFTTLVVGVAKLGDIKAVGRIGGKHCYGLSPPPL